MRYRLSGYVYSSIFFIIFVLDRISKRIALDYINDPIPINKFISFDLVFNRGFSWGILHSNSWTWFLFVSVIIGILIIVLASYTFICWMNDQIVLGEIIVLAGALSNVVDRIVYKGVIDFILISFGYWQWPVFNIADASIVIGVFIMFILNYKNI